MNISINNNNYISSESFRQEKSSLSSKEQLFITECLEYFSLSANLTRKGPARVLDFLLLLKNNGFGMKIARETIARSSGMNLSIKQVSRIVNDMKRHGFLRLKTRHKQAHTYILNEMFDVPLVRVALRHLIPQLHDARLSTRKYEAGIICENKLAHHYKTPLKVTDLKDDSEKMSRYLRGNIYNNSYEEEIDDGIPSLDYIPFDFDTDDIDILVSGNKISIKKEENIQKKVSSMLDLYTENIIPYANELQSIRPTIWGQVKLSAYPKEVVLHADTVTLNSKRTLATAFDRWRYLISVCSRYCKENDIETSWPLALEIGRELGMPNDGPFFDETHIPIQPKVSVSNNKYQKTNRSISSSTTRVNPYEHNQAIIKEYGPQLLNNPMPMTALEEFHHLVDTDPIRGKRLKDTAKRYREMMGLNEDGTFQPGRSPHEALGILMQVANENGKAKHAVTAVEQKCARGIQEEYDIIPEDYSSDPFGDFN